MSHGIAGTPLANSKFDCLFCTTYLDRCFWLLGWTGGARTCQKNTSRQDTKRTHSRAD